MLNGTLLRLKKAHKPVLDSLTCSMACLVKIPASCKSLRRPPRSPIFTCWKPADIWRTAAGWTTKDEQNQYKWINNKFPPNIFKKNDCAMTYTFIKVNASFIITTVKCEFVVAGDQGELHLQRLPLPEPFSVFRGPRGPPQTEGELVPGKS